KTAIIHTHLLNLSIHFSNLIIFIILSCLHLHYTYFFFFTDPATTEIYTLSLHDALPIYLPEVELDLVEMLRQIDGFKKIDLPAEDRKSTRLNSSHVKISYAVFCLKKKKKNKKKYI